MRIEELLGLGFVFSNGLDDNQLCKYLDEGLSKMIHWDGVEFKLVLNGCCFTKLNIENINDLILAIDLLQNNEVYKNGLC